MEGDDDELEDSDCLPRVRTKCPSCIVYFAHVLTRRGVYSRAAFISLSAYVALRFLQRSIAFSMRA